MGMKLAIADVLPAALLGAVRGQLAGLELVDGRATAGWAARSVKHNLQVAGATELKQQLQQQIAAHALLRLAAVPKAFSPVLLSCTRPGMGYGTHTDDAWMGSLRSDLAYTLFLSDPESYDGGELVIEDSADEASFKLPAGALVLYDCGQLHRVEPVTRGERWAAVGWIHSRVADASLRALLFELEQLRLDLATDRERDATGARRFLKLSQLGGQLLRRFSD